MISKSYSITAILRILATTLLLISCSDSPTNKPSSYYKDGFSLSLPLGWDVINDFADDSVRTLLVVSNDGGMLAIDIYQKSTDDTLLIPPINMYFKQYVLATMPLQQTKDTTKITYGTIERFLGESLYAELKISYPEAIQLFVETMRYEDSEFILYFTFQSPLSSAKSTNDVINLITSQFKIENT